MRASYFLEMEGALAPSRNRAIANKLMYFIIVGTGLESSILTEFSLNDSHQVARIEPSPERPSRRCCGSAGWGFGLWF